MKKSLPFFLISAIFIFTAFNQESAAQLNAVYDQMPDIGSCNAGALKETEKQKVLDEINYIRSIHELPPVTYDYSGDEKAAKASLIMAANGALSHQPPQDFHCWSQAGYDGAENSNLYISLGGGPSMAPASEESVVSWMHDQFTSNVGHRRAIINPFVDKISFGRVDGNPVGENYFASAMTLKYMDNLGGNIAGSDIEFVAYPYHDYPVEYFYNEWYLSFHAIVNKSNVWANQSVDYSQATVEMTDQGGNPVAVSDIIHDNQGWGALPNALKWKVPPLQQNVRYNVTIKNVITGSGGTRDYTYWFSLGEGSTPGPEKIALLQPQDDAMNIGLQPEFKWQQDQNSEVYELQVSKDPGFETSSLVIDRSVIATNYHVPDDNQLEGNVIYYWRVRGAAGQQKGEWSDVRSFTTVAAPSAVALISPEDDAANVSVTAEFEWQENPMADSYTFQIASSDDFSEGSMHINKNVADNTGYMLEASQKLDADTRYYWRVRGNNGEIEGVWSNTRTFVTEAAGSVQEILAISELTVFPNPAESVVFISISSKTETSAKISIVDIFGNKLVEPAEEYLSTGEQIFDVDISRIGSGTYYIVTEIGGNKISRPFVIIK